MSRRAVLVGLVLAFLLATGSPVPADYVGGGCGTEAFRLTPFASESIAVRGTVAVLTPKIYNQQSYKAQIAIFSVETADVRFWMDGSAPTATAGHVMKAGDYFSLCSPSMIERFKATRASATDAIVRVTYFAEQR